MTDFLAPALESRPDATALAGDRRTWTFRQLARDADALARMLGRSFGPGAPVAVVLPTGSAAVLAIHGITRAGGVVAPLNARLTAHELRSALEVLRPAAVITGDADAERVRGAVEEAGLEPAADAAAVPGVGRLLEVSGPVLGPEAEGAAAILWTSGTSGAPRGIVVGGDALCHVAEATRTRLGLSHGDRWYASLSPAHVGGLALIVRAALLGSTVVTRPGLDAPGLWALMDVGEVTHASLVPVLLRRLLEAGAGRGAPDGLRGLLVGGGAASRTLVERALDEGYPVALTYGLTEATSQVMTAPPELVRRKPRTVGPPLDGVEVSLTEDGEILVRGPTLALGRVGPEGFEARTGPWLRTGDLGAPDDEGHWTITGRRSDRIVTGGVTVDPGEVEAVLTAHPAVREAAVVGVSDDEWGERVAAAVVVHPGSPSALDDVEALCRERLTSAKVPRLLRRVDALPRNPNGKVDRRAVRRLFV